MNGNVSPPIYEWYKRTIHSQENIHWQRIIEARSSFWKGGCIIGKASMTQVTMSQLITTHLSDTWPYQNGVNMRLTHTAGGQAHWVRSFLAQLRWPLNCWWEDPLPFGWGSWLIFSCSPGAASKLIAVVLQPQRYSLDYASIHDEFDGSLKGLSPQFGLIGTVGCRELALLHDTFIYYNNGKQFD